MRRHRMRLLDRRTIAAAVAGVGVVAVAIYATSATIGTAQPVRVRAAAQVDQAVQAQTSTPFDIQSLIQQAQQLAGDGTASLPDLVQQFKDLLKKYGIDPAGIQSFVDQVKQDLAPEQLTDDARNFLV